MAAEMRITLEDSTSGFPGAPPAPAPAPGAPTPAAAPMPAPAAPGAPAPAPAPPGLSSTAAFDRPIPVVIMGPVPIRVTIDGGKSAPAPEPKTVAAARPRMPLAGRLAQGGGATAGAIGGFTAATAQNRGVEALTTVAGTAARGLATLGPYGMAAGAALGAAATATKAFTDSVNAFAARGRELAAFNGQLAGASAYADVSRFRSDRREAEVLGPQLARIIENQAKAEAVFQEVMLPIKDFLLQKLNAGVEAGLKGLLTILENFEIITKVALAASPLLGLAGLAFAATVDIKALAKEIRDILGGGAKVDLLAEWIKAGKEWKGPAAPGPRPGLGGVIRLP